MGEKVALDVGTGWVKAGPHPSDSEPAAMRAFLRVPVFSMNAAHDFIVEVA
jgi:hypothetical protein